MIINNKTNLSEHKVTDALKISEISRYKYLIIFVLQISAHECTKTSDISYMQYYVPNVTGKVPGCSISCMCVISQTCLIILEAF